MTGGKSVLVTGGAGYIGSHTVIELLQQNYNVISIDNLVNAFAASPNEKPEAIKRVECLTGKAVTCINIDIRDRQALDEVFKKNRIDCVVHLAALKSVGESCAKPLSYYQNNITGSCTLLEVMSANNVKKLVFSSSATVYGTPQKLPITEEHPTGQGLTNPYGKTKYMVEEIMKDICKADNEWSVISLRYFNPVGAHESGLIGESPTGIPNNLMPFIAQVAVGRRDKLSVFGNKYPTKDGTGVRDYIHIKDLAVGHVNALDKLFSPNFTGFKPYNLGTGNGYSVLEMVEAFKKASGRDIPYEIVEARPGDIAECYADASLALKELNWKPVKDINDMCKDTWLWQTKNANGFTS